MPERKTFVLITGCSPGGIGHALALEFHRRGCHVIATVRNTDLIKDLEAPGLSVVSLEVTEPESIAECKAKVSELTGGRLDILVNNAGRTHTIPALDMDLRRRARHVRGKRLWSHVHGPGFRAPPHSRPAV
ncbi:hypothetical protein NM208_g14794 [Fusarium decemcellulare]|uniref:Uncharacterized protein n=1 Tax=Fusarium decemcellulare TaxID=57161 RepID=A0ACC1REY7_9HYPO|nr:hypothetical protein NM208_g14794 [Fusarium decemcellulare]